jgi:hypothetical protein
VGHGRRVCCRRQCVRVCRAVVPLLPKRAATVRGEAGKGRRGRERKRREGERGLHCVRTARDQPTPATHTGEQPRTQRDDDTVSPCAMCVCVCVCVLCSLLCVCVVCCVVACCWSCCWRPHFPPLPVGAATFPPPPPQGHAPASRPRDQLPLSLRRATDAPPCCLCPFSLQLGRGGSEGGAALRCVCRLTGRNNGTNNNTAETVQDTSRQHIGIRSKIHEFRAPPTIPSKTIHFPPQIYPVLHQLGLFVAFMFLRSCVCCCQFWSVLLSVRVWQQGSERGWLCSAPSRRESKQPTSTPAPQAHTPHAHSNAVPVFRRIRYAHPPGTAYSRLLRVFPRRPPLLTSFAADVWWMRVW